ncbi:MAG: sigma-70 family RNA polymerase sigma factor [Oscillospiraceae bacterium]|nr:sigma-70 family RNA polymerase sigma factor [Oscillospiraceae bacterium]
MTNTLPARGGEEIISKNIEDIYNRNYDMIYRVGFSYLKNAEDTKDVVSEIFLKLLQKNINFESAEYEKAWLLRTTINLCKDFLKNWRRKNVNIDDYTNLEGDDPFQQDETLKVILNLPDKYKNVIYLYYYEGYNSEEIAKMLKKPHSTIRYHLQEARKLLKGVLEDEK